MKWLVEYWFEFLSVILVGAFLSWFFSDHRRGYCVAACETAAGCGMSLPPKCEDRCMLGHRTIELGATCDDLQRAIDKAGYLW